MTIMPTKIEEREQSPLDNLVLSFPCPVSWDNMDGDERERLCRQCSKKVFNISDLSKKEAEKLLSVNQDKKMCYTFFVRRDGTIKTDNCPAILRPVRERLKSLQKVCSVAMAFLFSISSGFAKENADSKKTQSVVPPEFTRTAGIIALPDFRDNMASLFFFEGEDLKNDPLIQTMHQYFSTYHSLTLEQLKSLEEHFKAKKMKTKEFLAKQAQLSVNLDRFGVNSNTDAQKDALEVEREKILAEIFSSTKKSLAEKKHDQAIREINECVMLVSNPYRAEQSNSKLKAGVLKWQLTCSGSSKSLLMTNETKNTLIDLLNKAQPTSQHEKDTKKNLLDGLNSAIKN